MLSPSLLLLIFNTAKATGPGYSPRTLGEIGAGRVAPLAGQSFPLSQASKADLVIESRETVAKMLLLCHLDGQP